MAKRTPKQEEWARQNKEMPKRLKPTSLLAIFDRVNSKYLGGLCCAGIQWKRLSTKDGSVVLGSADFDTRIISINRALQHPDVPTFALEGIILHEAIHLIYTPYQAEVDGYIGKDANHSDRFRAIEQKYDIINKTAKWEMEPACQDIIDEYNAKHKKR